MSKKNSLVLIIITIATCIIMTALATFAYFATKSRVDANVWVNAETAAATYAFTATSNGTIEMNISAVDMSEFNISSEKLKSDNATVEVSLASANDNTITSCTYDIVWVWDSNDKYTKSSLNLPYVTDSAIEQMGTTREGWNQQLEFAIADGFDEEDYVTATFMNMDNAAFINEFSAKVEGYKEKDLSKMNAGSIPKSLVIQKGVGIASTNTTAVKQTHTVESNIYNLPVDQTNLFNKNFKAHITIENVKCTMTESSETKNLATYITNDVYNHLSNQGIVTHSNKGAGLYYHSNDNLTDLPNNAQDNSYRYAGADEDVNNWVCFAGSDCTNEDNLYRIISVDSTNKTKIIKAKNIGMMKWNEIPSDYDYSYDINKWQGSTLEKYLNNEYLTSLGEKASLVDTATWSVGGASYDDLQTKNVYEFMGVELANTTTYTGKVGLMYAYEYGYAALPEYWENKLYNNSSDGYNLSFGSNWMLTLDFPWTISRYSDDPDLAFYIDSDRGGMNSYFVTLAYGVRPVLNLLADAKILNPRSIDVGTKTNPMIII